MTAHPDRAIASAAAAVRARLGGLQPRIAIVLGSGLGGLVRRIADPVEIPYAAIPGFPIPAIPGHAGRAVAGRIGEAQVLAYAGRFHPYEGHSPADVALPVRVAHALGAHTLLVSNAAGGIRHTFRTGDLMLIRDHLNLMWRNPLVGPVHHGELRFPDMSSPYDDELLTLLRAAAHAAAVPFVEGIYAGVLGPSYETPAEIRMLERFGADAVGMSTVPEVLCARAADMRVAGVSCITNAASGIGDARLDHADVLRATGRAQEAFDRLVVGWVRQLCAGDS
ncbi:MAG TPA: purine-nucleoside phosphorylase [Gemmatimonadaceae bacterium]|nr:purine-nucleoside phosphorylase [Gemmatimonadaceae bacterium]